MSSSILRIAGLSVVLGFVLPLGSAAETSKTWDQKQVTELAAQLHEGVKGLRAEIRGTPQDLGTGKAAAYYRLTDNLRLIERETRYLHNSLESGAQRDESLPTYRRIVTLRRDCAEEMERLYLGTPALKRIFGARAIVAQMNPFYGMAEDHGDHERVLEP